MGTMTSDPKRQLRAADIRPASWDPTARTVELVWTTGAAVKRYDWEIGEYMEILEVTPEAVDLSRLNARAPLLDTHQSYELEHVIGVVLEARIEGGIGVARVQLSARPEVAGIRQDVADGVISQVSVGYDHIEWRDEQREDGRYRVVTRWLPVELSLVPVPADAGSQTRSRSMDEQTRADDVRADEELADETQADEELAEGEDMPEEEPPPAEPETMSVQTAIQVERQRVTEIQAAARVLSYSADHRTVRRLVDDGVSLDKARATLINMRARAQEKTMTRNTHGSGVEVGTDAQDNVSLGIVAALQHRAGASMDVPEVARPYVHMRLLDLCRYVAERQGNRGVRSWDDSRVIRTAMRARGERRLTRDGYHTTSDFPLLLADVANKTMADEYKLADPTYRRWMRRTTLSDFKPARRLQLGSAFNLSKVLESGEIKGVTLPEKSESIQLDSYGAMLALTRRMIINDDLDAFGRLPRIFARSTANNENRLAYEMLVANPTLNEDSKAVYHADHNNYGTATAEYAPGIDAWKWGNKALMKQTSLDGTPMNMGLAMVVCPVAQSIEWQQVVAGNYLPTTAAGARIPGIENLAIVTDAILDQYSEDIWYGFADPNANASAEYGYLAGQTGPRIESEDSFDVDGTRMRVLADFGVAFVDYRGTIRNDGEPA